MAEDVLIALVSPMTGAALDGTPDFVTGAALDGAPDVVAGAALDGAPGVETPEGMPRVVTGAALHAPDVVAGAALDGAPDVVTGAVLDGAPDVVTGAALDGAPVVTGAALDKRATQNDIYYYLVSCTSLYDKLTDEKKRISFCGLLVKTGNPLQGHSIYSTQTRINPN